MTASTTARGYGWEFQRLRPLVLQRDGHVCQLRLPGCTVHATAVDHIVTRRQGGLNVLANLRASCTPCNSRRANQARGRRGHGGLRLLASASIAR